MKARCSLLVAAVLGGCATTDHSGTVTLGKVTERTIVGSALQRTNPGARLALRERARSTEPAIPSSVPVPVYEHVVQLESGRTVRVRSSESAYSEGACVRVVESSEPSSPSRLLSGSGCRQ
jgi:hypothetical protein